MTALNKWAAWYADDAEQVPYGGDLSYQLAADWLDGLDVEDWGCGLGWYRLHHRGGYVGVDGTATRWCDVHADLATYRSTAGGVLLRHVLEHNHQWADILDNAAATATRRLCIVVFTPLVEQTAVLVDDVAGLGVPDIAFALADLTDRLAEFTVKVETFPSPDTGYEVETIIRAERG